jgi:flagellar basal body-associated protein FliL
MDFSSSKKNITLIIVAIAVLIVVFSVLVYLVKKEKNTQSVDNKNTQSTGLEVLPSPDSVIEKTSESNENREVLPSPNIVTEEDKKSETEKPRSTLPNPDMGK